MKVTVITNSYQRNLQLVERSLLSSLKLHPPIHKLIFIDQNPLPLALSKEIKNNARFEHIFSSSKCVSKARNEAPFEITSDWLIFCDDDGFFASDYLQALTTAVNENPDVLLFAGSIIRDDNNQYYTPRQYVGGDMMRFNCTKLLMGSNFAIKPQAFISIEKFDDMFGAGSYWGSGEETDLAWKAYFNHVPMRYERSLRVYHVKPYAESWTASMRKAFRYGRGKGALVSKWLIKRKFIVAYEIIEMYGVPLVQIVRFIFLFRWSQVPIQLSTLLGRTWGMFAYPLQLILSKKTRANITS